LGAAAFIGLSILVMSTVMMNMRAKGRRARVMNETDSMVLAINQLVANRDLCVTAFRTGAGGFPVIQVNPPAPNGLVFTVPIARVYLGSGATQTLQACAEPDPATSPAECRAIRNPIVYVRGIQFTMLNDAASNRTFTWNGDASGRYRQLSGQIRVGSGVLTGRIPLGGILQPRQFPIQMIVDTGAAGAILSCYSGESPVQLCLQMGGTLDPATGTCTGLLGECSAATQPPIPCAPVNPPPAPTACLPPDLQWVNHYYAIGLDRNLKVLCACNVLCTENP